MAGLNNNYRKKDYKMDYYFTNGGSATAYKARVRRALKKKIKTANITGKTTAPIFIAFLVFG